MAKKQLNLYLDGRLVDAIRDEVARQGYDGPSELIRRDLLAYLKGDLSAIHRMLEHALTRVDTPVDQRKLKLIKLLVDSFTVG